MRPSNRLDPIKFNRALAARGLDGAALAKLAVVNNSTVSRARRGQGIRATTVEKLIRTLDSVPILEGVEDLLA